MQLKQHTISCFHWAYFCHDKCKSNKAIVDIRLRPRVQSYPHFAADNRLVQRLQSSVCSCRVLQHDQSDSQLLGVLGLSEYAFPKNAPYP